MVDTVEVIGEVVEASTTEFLAESRELHAPPPFGSFVKVGWAGEASTTSRDKNTDDPFESQTVLPAVYAVVHHASTTPVDAGRRLRAFWKDEESLREEQPELTEWMLVTNFRAIIIGYSNNGCMHQVLPPMPPKLLTPVHPCSPEEIRFITGRMDFLRTLAGFKNTPTEEVVAACIREADAARGGDFQFLVSAGKELASVLRDDYDRLQAIMRRLAP